MQERTQRRARVLRLQTLLVYIYSGHQSDVAARFWVSHTGTSLSLGEAAAHVEWLYISASVDEKVEMMLNPRCSLGLRPLMVALRFIVELQLLSWVQFQNYECGVAPSRKMLLDHAQSCVPKDLPPSLTARLLRPFKTARSQRKALAAFRMKHRCKLGKLRSEAPIPLAEKQDKALAFYQWCNYWQANTEREPLLINMDESSLAFHWSGLAGTVAEAAVSVATDKAKLSSRRARVTYLCCITHDSTVQPLLPQVLLGNSRSFPLEFVKQAAEVEPGITVWREKSAWNSHRLMRKFLRLLCARLGDLLKTRSVGLLLDFAP
ncbi:unnamed protein product, partial [Durusdinium trenchii]